MPTTYKILSNNQLLRLIPYAKEIIRDHQCGLDFKKAYDSVRREVLYRILLQFGIPRKLVRLIKMSLNETYSRARVGENVSDRNGLKIGDALSLLFFNFALEYTIRRLQANQDG